MVGTDREGRIASFYKRQILSLAWHGIGKELLNRDWFSTSFGGAGECQRSFDHHDQIVQRYNQPSSIQFGGSIMTTLFGYSNSGGKILKLGVYRCSSLSKDPQKVWV